nr:F420H2:quinone oxidoreductase [Coprobacter secundus]
MIEIKDKEDCCGCWACVQRCPKQCISMKEDEEGFLYPHVDSTQCVNCGLCKKVCPVINQAHPHEPLSVTAARNIDEIIRRQSSSGGIFTLLAEKVIKEGGVVFGARFNDHWEVVHDSTDTIEGIAAFRGSKYVQSSTGDCFIKTEQLLKQGRRVLYSGTPCQIAGLKRFLQRDYDNLITTDVICHGVPSPGVWQKYLSEETAHQINKGRFVYFRPFRKDEFRIINISFRDKYTSWKQYSFTLSLSKTNECGESLCYRRTREENIFMRGFTSDLYLRPSCYQCPTKELKSGSDITIGDFWGIEHIMPHLDDDRGLCCLLVNTERGQALVNSIDAVQHEANYKDIIRYNPSLVRSSEIPSKRMEFFSGLPKYGMLRTTERLTRNPFILRCKNAIHNSLKKLGLR